MKLKTHPAADSFPMMDSNRYAELVADIKEHGQLEPITLCDGMILDGRNRYKACLELGIDPKTRQYDGDPWAYVWSLNGQRRDLVAEQRYLIWKLCHEQSEAFQAEKRRIQEEANRKRSEAAKGNDNASKEMPGKTVVEHSVQPLFSQAEKPVVGRSAQPPKKEPKERKAKATASKTNPGAVARGDNLAKNRPDLAEKVRSGELKPADAHRQMKADKRKEERTNLAEQGARVKNDERWNVYHGNMETIELNKQYDFIITDPPYSKQYLPLYETLAIRSNEWLKDGGLLVAMCGQSYLNEIYAMLSKHLTYYWTAAYLTPGQPTPLRQVNVNTTWKPLLIFRNGQYKGKIFGDVFKSDRNEKEYHKWGQSESGMYDIISKMCLPGQSILDPFCGAGTTGVAALQFGCLFDGIELNIENVNISKARLNDTETMG
jgi:site-specific DNA-methyltransferase (adenine-specific)